MAGASEIFDLYKNGDIDKRLKKAQRVADLTGNDALSSTLGKVKAGREMGKEFRKRRLVSRTKKAAKKAMKGPKSWGK